MRLFGGQELKCTLFFIRQMGALRERLLLCDPQQQKAVMEEIEALEALLQQGGHEQPPWPYARGPE
jgi:hypothetical protein